jgi:hypothetical protein
MKNMKTFAAKATVSILAIGSLAAGGSGLVAATTSGAAASSAAAATATSKPPHSGDRQQFCARLATFEHNSSERLTKFDKGTAWFAGLEAKAAARGDTKLAAYWGSVVDHRNASSHKHHERRNARILRVSAAHHLVNGKCV